jgi:restriction endonuclease S subunit
MADEVPVLSIKDINQPLTPVGDLPKIQVAPREIQRFEVRAGDVVVTTRGTTVRAAVIEPSHAGTIVGLNLAIVRVGPQLAPTLLAAFLREPHTQETLLRNTAGSVTPGFTLKALGGLSIRVPSPERQKVLVEYLAAADAYRNALSRALELRQLASNALIAKELSAPEAA